MPTKERLIIENMLMIANKEKGDVPFILNTAQSKIDNNLTGRDIIPKARQEGVSSYFLARSLVKCLSERNTSAVVISHETEATQRMLAKVYYFIENIRGPKPIIKTSSKNEITFPKMNSRFYIGTAGARKFGRGDTITNLHCSEVAFWPDPKSLTAGLFQAVPRGAGEISIESTGNGVGNWYHNRCMYAAKGVGKYRLHFLDWLSFPEYSAELTYEEAQEILNNLDPLLEEDVLVRDHGLSAGQIAFRRETLEDMDFDLKLFKQEYPMTLDECFQSSGHSIFHRVLYEPTDKWQQVDAHTHNLEPHPIKGYHYAIGADVSGGVGSDFSVVEVTCVETMEQVAEYHNNKISPDIFAGHIAQMGEYYNLAYVTVESNNHGIVTLKELSDTYNYPSYLIHRDRRVKASNNKSGTKSNRLLSMGQRTTVASKPLLIGKLRKLLATELVIHSPILNGECSTFVETPEGKLEAVPGCHDDCVIAMAESVSSIEMAGLITGENGAAVRPGNDPFALDSIIEDLQGRDKGYPISSGV